MEDCIHLPLWGIFILFLLLWLNGIFYGFAAAFKNLSENEIERRTQEGDKKAALIKGLMESPAQFINAIPLVVMASGIYFGTFMVPFLTKTLQPYIKHALAMVLVTSLMVLLLASLGILAFRRVGYYFSEKFAYRYVKIVCFFVNILSPFTYLISWLAKFASLPFGVKLDQTEEAVTEEEIISIVDEAHEQGVIEENEAEMIQNIISFNETEAKDIMTHRKNVVAFDDQVLLQEMIDTMLEEGNSRYPVYKENIDNIVGIVHYKDVLKFNTRNSWAKFKPLNELPGLIRKAAFIPETRGIGDLFRSMQAKKLHMAIVVDEYGQTAGIVSMEDILEEIVGEIMDEYDDEEEAIRTQKDNSVIIDGLSPLEDVEEKLDISFGELEFETLNGYLTSLLGHIPTRRDLDSSLTAKGYKFTILSLGNKTVGKVRAEKIQQENKETKGE